MLKRVWGHGGPRTHNSCTIVLANQNVCETFSLLLNSGTRSGQTMLTDSSMRVSQDFAPTPVSVTPCEFSSIPALIRESVRSVGGDNTTVIS